MKWKYRKGDLGEGGGEEGGTIASRLPLPPSPLVWCGMPVSAV